MAAAARVRIAAVVQRLGTMTDMTVTLLYFDGCPTR